METIAGLTVRVVTDWRALCDESGGIDSEKTRPRLEGGTLVIVNARRGERADDWVRVYSDVYLPDDRWDDGPITSNVDVIEIRVCSHDLARVRVYIYYFIKVGGVWSGCLSLDDVRRLSETFGTLATIWRQRGSIYGKAD